MMRILALDLGTKTGWALSPVESGVWNLAPRRFEGSGMRFVTFRQHLKKTLDSVELVYFEEVRKHMGVDAAHVYGGLMAVVTEECESRKIPYQGIPVGTIKRAGTGKGNASKQEMIQAACNKWPLIKIIDDNHADALHLLAYGSELNGQVV